ncbi:MAG: SdrD B-like domain-containing protein [Pseudomonadota bacterium]
MRMTDYGRKSAPALGAIALSIGLAAAPVSALANDGIVGGRVWHDLNRNGLQDENEEACSGVQIQLDAKLEPKAWYFTATDADGNYEFADLPNNRYIAHFQVEPGGFTKINQGDDDTIDSDAKANGAVPPFTLTDADPTRFNIDAGYKEGCPEVCIPVQVVPEDDVIYAELGDVIDFDVLANDEGTGQTMLMSGELPADLELTLDGRITGTANEIGEFEIVYKLVGNDCFEAEAKVTIVITEPPPKPKACDAEEGSRSLNSHRRSFFAMMNNTDSNLELHWIDYHGERRLYRTVEPGKKVFQRTYLTHPWVVVDPATGDCVDFIHQAKPRFWWKVDADSNCDTCKAKRYARSVKWNEPVWFKVMNTGDRDLKMYWIDYRGRYRFYRKIRAGETISQDSYKTHPWVLFDAKTWRCVDFRHQATDGLVWKVN